jgi:flagellar secretion chaperone FliS
MFGQNKRGVNVYAQVSMETGVLAASPNKLIIMLYEGAIAACYSAIRHMQISDIPNKGAMISQAILIIERGLRLSLNKKAGGEIAESLDALYAYMSSRLTMANVRNQPELVHEVIKLLVELKGAWEAIGNTQAASPVIAVDQANQGAAAVNRNIANYAKV